MQNVEFKAELRDLVIARAVCRAIGATHIGELLQTDTYYNVPSGRLKRRVGLGEAPEYIFYDRPNISRPKLSTFTIYSEDLARERFGTHPLPEWVRVRKLRELWMLNNVRIHLDQVETLGNFLEFECLICESQTIDTAHEVLRELRHAFQQAIGEPIDRSYADLLAAEQETPTERG